MCIVCQTLVSPPTFAAQAQIHASLLAPVRPVQGTYLAPIPQSVISAVADQLVNGYWEHRNQSWSKFTIDPGGALSVNISGLTAAGQETAILALDSWTQTTGIRFAIVDLPGAEAQITIDDRYSGAFATRTLSGHVTQSAQVNVAADWTDIYGSGVGSYALQTFVHEIGHALGLGHAGNYNSAANFTRDASIPQDSWQVSVMSYFSQVQNQSTGASYAFLTGPMQADILAMQMLYGSAGAVNPGNTVYGVGSMAGAVQTRIGAMMTDGHLDRPISFVVKDSGGYDSLNLSTDRSNQSINLSPGGASGVYGLVGNLLIERSTVIEQVQAGQGHDFIQGNAANNQIFGNAGNDRIYGGNGNDRLYGGAGDDRIYGGDGQNSLNGGAGADRLVSSAGTDSMTGGTGADKFVFSQLVPGRVIEPDVICDFTKGVDRINLGAIGPDGAWFQISTEPRFTAAQQLRLVQRDDGTLILGDVTGDRVADFEILVRHVTGLTASDFML